MLSKHLLLEWLHELLLLLSWILELAGVLQLLFNTRLLKLIRKYGLLGFSIIKLIWLIYTISGESTVRWYRVYILLLHTHTKLHTLLVYGILRHH